MKNILVLIDGFNFYHKLKTYQSMNNVCVKWLNYKELIKSYFKDYDDYNFEYYYFSAYADFRGDDVVERHKTYVKALKSENIKVILGKFKEKFGKKCRVCNTPITKEDLKRHEEKNTDVNIAITLIEKAIKKEYDKCFILSADSDFNSAITRAKELYPEGIITIVPPPIPNNNTRKGKYNISALQKLTATNPLFVSWEKIKQNQFPDNFNGLKNPFKV